MSATRFVDAEPPTWAPVVAVDAADGSVTLWQALDPSRRAWFARVTETVTDETTDVAWSRPRGEPARYACARCGDGRSRALCRHTEAAVRASRIFEKEA